MMEPTRKKLRKTQIATAFMTTRKRAKSPQVSSFQNTLAAPITQEKGIKRSRSKHQFLNANEKTSGKRLRWD